MENQMDGYGDQRRSIEEDRTRSIMTAIAEIKVRKIGYILR